MSGVFMDGGNHDGGHHGISHGIQMDSSQGHGHAMHGAGGHGQSIIAHILGLDNPNQGHHGGGGHQGSGHEGGHHGQSGPGHVPAQTPFWSSALQGVKLQNVFQGINITPNFLLLLLFTSFTAWLGVIYWIRHNEPLANQVLGSGDAYAPTAVSDRSMLHGMKEAFPVKTSHRTGSVYTPPVGASARADAILNAGANKPAMSESSGAVANFNQMSAGVMHAPGESMGNGAFNQAGIQQGQAPQAMSGQAQQFQAGQPNQAMAPGPAALGMSGGARLCSARNGMPHGPMAPANAALPPGFGAAGARLCSARNGMLGIASPTAGGSARLFTNRAPAAPAANYAPPPQPVGWSLGTGSFSSDTAQFSSDFGAPSGPVVAEK